MKSDDLAWWVTHDRVIKGTVAKAVEAGETFFVVEADAWDVLAAREMDRAQMHSRDMESAEARSAAAKKKAVELRASIVLPSKVGTGGVS